MTARNFRFKIVGGHRPPLQFSSKETSNMRSIAITLLLALFALPALAQKPSDPALLVPQTAPELAYVSVPDPFTFPAGMTFAGAPAAVTFDSKGHLFVVTRGNPSLYEFDNNGKFIRSFVEGLFTRTHGVRVDKD